MKLFLAFLFSLVPVLAQPAFVNGGGCDFGNNATTCTFTLALTSGNMIVGGIDTGNTSNTTSFGDTCNTYTAVIGSPFIPTGANSILFGVWTAPVICTGTKTFTCTVSTGVGGGSGSNCGVVQLSGCPCTIDRVTSNDNGSQSISASPTTGTTLTTRSANESLVGLFGGAVSGGSTMTITAGSGYTIRQQTVINFGRYYSIETQGVTATGAYSGSITVSQPTGNTIKTAGVIVTIGIGALGSGSIHHTVRSN